MSEDTATPFCLNLADGPCRAEPAERDAGDQSEPQQRADL